MAGVVDGPYDFIHATQGHLSRASIEIWARVGGRCDLASPVVSCLGRLAQHADPRQAGTKIHRGCPGRVDANAFTFNDAFARGAIQLTASGAHAQRSGHVPAENEEAAPKDCNRQA